VVSTGSRGGSATGGRTDGHALLAGDRGHSSDAGCPAQRPECARHQTRRHVIAPGGERDRDLGSPGLKFMRTLWVCNVAGGPFEYSATVPGSTALGLEEAHRRLHISPDEFDEVAAELGRTLDVVGVPATEKAEVLAAFSAHKGEVTEGYLAGAGTGR
jgi:hypothetical protein